MSDPLSPSSLAAVPEVRTTCPECGDGCPGWTVQPRMPDGEAEQVQCRRCDEDRDLATKVRDAVLSAHRDALLKLTPEQVVEEAAKAVAWFNFDGSVYRDAEELWEAVKLSERERYRGLVRAALPVLLAPEVAKREQAEALLKRMDTELLANMALMNESVTKSIAAEAEVARLRGALTFYADEKNYRQRAPFEPGDTIVNDDNGDKARATLEAK